MKVIGLTGGIGTGKSTAAEYIIKKGYAHVDADQIGRDITADGMPLLEIIGDRFGCVNRSCNTGNGLVLDRKAMADLVFRNPDKRREFDRIVHAEIIKIIDGQISGYKEKGKTDPAIKGILLDAPLLFEAGINDRCDEVILIVADIDERIRRVMLRDNTTEEAVRDRISSQMGDGEKSRLADFIVDNSGTPEEMFRQIDEILFASFC